MADAALGWLDVEVVWIGVDPPLRVPLRVAAGTTVGAALGDPALAAALARRGGAAAGDAIGSASVAVYGRTVAPAEPLHDGDRIELLPPLRVDPKVARQRRAEHRRRASGERRWSPDRERRGPTADRVRPAAVARCVTTRRRRP